MHKIDLADSEHHQTLWTWKQILNFSWETLDFHLRFQSILELQLDREGYKNMVQEV